MNKTEKLLPCPLCGSESKHVKADVGGHRILCWNDDCECSSGYFCSKEEAITSWNTRAALAATPAAEGSVSNATFAAAPVVLPEPDFYVRPSIAVYELPWQVCNGSASAESVYLAATVRALLATVTGKSGSNDSPLLAGVSAPAAPAITLLAGDHSGMKVDYRGLFKQVQRAIKRSDPGYAEMLRQLEDHLQELGQRWYAGDTNVVDEILQLYCIERDARKTVGAAATAAPQAQAVERDAEQERWMEIGKAIERACIDQPDSTEIVISLERDAGTVTMFDPDGNEHDQFSHEDGFAGVVNAAIEAAIEAAKEQG